MAYFLSTNIISSIGFTSEENFSALKNGVIGIKPVSEPSLYPEDFMAATINRAALKQKLISIQAAEIDFTFLERTMIYSIKQSLENTNVDPKSKSTLFIISTTKGNVDLLEKSKRHDVDPERVALWRMAEVISSFFGNPNKAICISNACISGVLALNTAAMYINADQYENIIVCGGDIISRFVVSGFMSFLSLSDEPCKPFDRDRNGLSLGEAAGTIILSKNPSASKQGIKFIGGATANDANHISGPSRTAEGSYIAIKKAMSEAGISPGQIDHISAHGTATPYNDEMESIAISRHNLQDAATNGIKGSVGHTLGAAGIIETAILLEEMRNNTLLKTSGYKNHGLSEQINISTENSVLELNTCLKMASGFGGSNAALIIQKI